MHFASVKAENVRTASHFADGVNRGEGILLDAIDHDGFNRRISHNDRPKTMLAVKHIAIHCDFDGVAVELPQTLKDLRCDPVNVRLCDWPVGLVRFEKFDSPFRGYHHRLDLALFHFPFVLSSSCSRIPQTP